MHAKALDRRWRASLKNRHVPRPGRGIKVLSRQPSCRTEIDAYWTTISNGAVFLLMNTPRMAVEQFQSALAGYGEMEMVVSWLEWDGNRCSLLDPPLKL